MRNKTERKQAIKAHSRRCPWDIDTATSGRTTPSSAIALAAAMLYSRTLAVILGRDISSQQQQFSNIYKKDLLNL